MSRALARCAIAFDIDGVFWRSPQVFPFTKSVLESVEKKRIPFILLTNGGGSTEEERAKKLSKLFDVKLKASQLVLSHTPLKQHIEELKDRLVLVAGNKNVHEVALDYGLKRVINASEIISAHPIVYPFNSQHKMVPKHRELNDITSYHPSNVEAICVMDDGECWGSEIQLIVDCLIHGKKSEKFPNHPPIFFSNPDLLWTNVYSFPRFAQGIYAHCIRSIYEKLTGKQLQYVQFGKPTSVTMQYAQKTLIEEAKKLGFGGVESKNCYMIGDNINSDIAGGKSIGWNTILVKTGVYNDSHPFDGNPTFKCQNVEEAVNLIFSKHSV